MQRKGKIWDILGHNLRDYGHNISNYSNQYNLSHEERLEVAYEALRLLGVKIGDLDISSEEET